MNFALDDDHLMLRESARVFLDKEINLAPLLVPGATVGTPAMRRRGPRSPRSAGRG